MAPLTLFIPGRVTSSYAAAHYGKSLFWYMTELLFGFYLAEIYQLPPATLGMLLGVFLLWDAVTDPMIAFVVLRRKLSTRDLLIAQLVGAILSSAVFCLLFYRPPLEGESLVLYALATGIGFRTAYTLYDVPQNALMKRLAADSAERLTLSTVRAAFSALATLTISFASAIILSGGDIGEQTQRFVLAAALFVLLATASSALLLTCTTHDEPAQPAPVASLSRVARATLLNANLLALFATISILSIGWPLFSKLLPFYASAVRSDAASTGLYLAAIAFASLFSQPLWLAIDRRGGRHAVRKSALYAVLVGAALFAAGASQPVAIGIAGVSVLAAGASACGMLAWAQLADRLTEERLSEANDVLAFGVFTFASKIALSLGGLFLGLGLSFAGYESGQQLDASGKDRLVWLMALAPVGSTIITSILLARRA